MPHERPLATLDQHKKTIRFLKKSDLVGPGRFERRQTVSPTRTTLGFDPACYNHAIYWDDYAEIVRKTPAGATAKVWSIQSGPGLAPKDQREVFACAGNRPKVVIP